MNNENRKNQMTNSRFGKAGWSMIIETLLLYYFWAGTSTDGMNIYPDAFAAAYGMDANRLLSFATIAGFIGVVAGLIFGRLIIRTGSRRLSAILLVLCGAVYIWFGWASRPAIYLICLILFTCLAMGFGGPAPSYQINNWFPRKKGIALGWATMGAPICTATFVTLLSVMIAARGLHFTFLIMGIVIIVFGIVSFFWVRDYPQERGAYPDNIKDEAGVYESAEETKEYKSPYTIGQVLKMKNMWLIALGFGALWMVTIAVVSQFVPRMMSVGFTNATALTLLTVAAIFGIVGSYLWGWLDQKIGTKPATVIYACCFIVALLLLVFVSGIVSTVIASIFVGLCIGGLLNLMPSMAISCFGNKDFQYVYSIIFPIANLLNRCAFAVMAFFLTLSGGSYTLPYLVFIFIDIVGTILVMCVSTKVKGNKKNEPTPEAAAE
ncbi:MAG: MFS transporter [Lachnospiraceae bacterium]|nr:MFS transporter [Lachnospiraceae bacterium]